MKKIVTILMVLVLSFAMVFAFPQEQAKANPLAVGGALYLGGAGVYVVGAVGIAAIAGVAGCESCQEDIEAHAARTWEGSTQIVKDGFQLMVDASVGAWGATSSALTAVDSNVNTWVDGQLANIASNAIGSKYAYDSVTANHGDFVFHSSSTHRGAYFTTSANSTKSFFAHGLMFSEVRVLKISDSVMYVQYFYPVGGSFTVNEKRYDKVTYPQQYASFEQMFSVATTADATLALATAMGSAFGYGLKTNMQSDFANVNSRATEAWEEMTDAGLVLPVDNARPMYNDIPLTYDPVTDTYAGIDGITVPHEDVTGFEYQQPHWKTVDDLAALGLTGLGAGLYIDGWANSDSVTSTYDPTADLTTTVTTGTTTGVTTGVTSTTTTTTTTTGDTTGNPPVEPPPVTPPKAGEPINPFKGVVPGASILSLFQLLVAIIWYLIRMFTFVATIAFIAPTPIDNPYFIWFSTATFYGITPFPLVQNLALFFLGFSIYKSIRRVF